MSRVIVVGGGMGGLSAATRLARGSHEVTLLEARTTLGGLASSTVFEGRSFDTGPYILLDRPGLEWAFAELGLDLDRALDLHRIEAPYEVTFGDDEPIAIFADRSETAARLDRRWPGSGRRYESFIDKVTAIHSRVRPMLFASHPTAGALLRSGAVFDAPFLLRSLGSVLRSSGLPDPVQQALAIWTHVAGQSVSEAPSPMAFVPALIHGVGAWLPRGGIGRIPEVLAAHAESCGVTVRTGARVTRIRIENGRARGVLLATGEELVADAVLSDVHGVGTYLDLVDHVGARFADELRGLPLQSPGVAAYLEVTSTPPPAPYLRFWVPPVTAGSALDPACRLLIAPPSVDAQTVREGAWAGRLLMPMKHDDASKLDEPGQEALLDSILAEPWWQRFVPQARVVGRRIPKTWGQEHHLHRDSMNPVMTARFMRKGRLAHESPVARGLYLAGSATHPGQWVSFAAISGILSADRLAAAVDNLG